MQSASAHIHLASSHDHDGHGHGHGHGHDHGHDHSQVVHAHNVASHHIDAFESEQESHGSQVVELCQDWIVKYVKWLSDLDPQVALVPNFSCCEQKILIQSYFDNVLDYRSFHFRSKVKARAPPILFPSHV